MNDAKLSEQRFNVEAVRMSLNNFFKYVFQYLSNFFIDFYSRSTLKILLYKVLSFFKIWYQTVITTQWVSSTVLKYNVTVWDVRVYLPSSGRHIEYWGCVGMDWPVTGTCALTCTSACESTRRTETAEQTRSTTSKNSHYCTARSITKFVFDKMV